MIKRLCLTISSLIFLTCLSACGGTGDSIKNDRRFMVSALGFEADGFLIKVTAELIVINSENPEVSPEARVFSAKSRDIEGALEEISSRLSKPMLLEHCGIIAIGESMTAERFSQICDYCFYENRITLSAYMISAKSPELLLGGKPESSAATGYDIMNMIERQSKSDGISTDSRFFEIESARESGKDTFALPRFGMTEDGVADEGIAIFENDRLVRLVSREAANSVCFRLPGRR